MQNVFIVFVFVGPENVGCWMRVVSDVRFGYLLFLSDIQMIFAIPGLVQKSRWWITWWFHSYVLNVQTMKLDDMRMTLVFVRCGIEIYWDTLCWFVLRFIFGKQNVQSCQKWSIVWNIPHGYCAFSQRSIHSGSETMPIDQHQKPLCEI